MVQAMERKVELNVLKPSAWEREFEERRKSLLSDGYIERVAWRTSALYMCILRHRTNGNKVSLKAYPSSRTVIQTTNGYLKYIATF